MIKSNEQILEYVKSRSENIPSWVIVARNKSTEYKQIVTGQDFDQLLIQIEHLENDAKIAARKKYSRSIKDTMSKILAPSTLIYTATGGSSSFNNIEPKKIISHISHARSNKTLRKWLEFNWLELYATDPNGLIFYEASQDGNKIYPTYKSIASIRDYECDGQLIEYVLFEPELVDGKKLFRYVDDATDAIIEQDGEKFRIINEETITNSFRKCQGIVISDIEAIGEDYKISYIDNIVELAKEYLRDSSVKTLFKFLHGFPIFWRYAVKCRKCHGLGKDEQGGKCPDCSGLGFYIKKDITDSVTLPVPDDKEKPVIAPDIAGYISPDLDTWDRYDKELELLEIAMYVVMWGQTNLMQNDAITKTATEVIYDNQQKITELNKLSDTAEFVEKQLVEFAANYIYDEKSVDEEVYNCQYGRNYILIPESVLLETYNKNREKGANTAILDNLLVEYITSKYATNVIKLSQELKRIQVEPYVHYTAEQIKGLLSNEECTKKMLFTDFWNEADKNKDANVLKMEFENWIKLRELEEEEEEYEDNEDNNDAN